MRPVTLAATVLAVVPSVMAKSAIVWFEDDSVTDEIIQGAKDAITKAGGIITHTYDIIKGFSAEAPEDAFKQVRVQFEQAEHPMRIDEDQEVGTFKA